MVLTTKQSGFKPQRKPKNAHLWITLPPDGSPGTWICAVFLLMFIGALPTAYIYNNLLGRVCIFGLLFDYTTMWLQMKGALSR
jgi:hypothetical protein